MKVYDKLKREDGKSVFLYKEGAFWVAYEQSAFALSNHKRLKATKKHIKAVGGEVISVGFPPSVLDFFQDHLGFPVALDESCIQFYLTAPVDSNLFESWKNDTPLSIPQATTKNNTPKQELKEPERVADTESGYSILNHIRTYPLGERSPIETMLFVKELKDRVELLLG